MLRPEHSFPFLFLLAAVFGSCQTRGERTLSEDDPSMPTESLVVPAFELKDQEGRLQRYPGTTETPAVFVVAGPDGVDSNIQWDRWLVHRYGETILLFRVMDFSSIPRIFEPIAVSRVRKGADPPGIPILLDWEKRFSSLLPLSKEASTVIVAGGDGRVALVVRGAPDAELKRQVSQRLDSLLERRDVE